MSTIAATNLKNAGSGSNNVVLNADGTTTLTPSNIIKSGTAVASTSGTSIDFTGLPGWVKRVTVMFDRISTSGTSNCIVQLGTTGGFQASSYVGSITNQSASATSTFSSGFLASIGFAATDLSSGVMYLAKVDGNTWAETSVVAVTPSSGATRLGCGVVTLSGTLDHIRVTTVNGTDTFDAGTINILYEG